MHRSATPLGGLPYASWTGSALVHDVDPVAA